jgi:hypothetical protein
MDNRRPKTMFAKRRAMQGTTAAVGNPWMVNIFTVNNGYFNWPVIVFE